MAEKVKVVITDGEIQWPPECASCTGKDGLTSVHIGIAKDTSTLVDRGLGRARYDTLGLHYPVCREHAGFAGFAGWLTRKSPLPRMLRWGAYLFGPPALLLGVLTTLFWLLRVGVWAAAPSKAPNPFKFSPPDSLPFVAIMAVCAALLILVVMSYRRVPLRLVKLEPDAVTIRFANERFARHFVRANKDIVIPGK